MVGGLEAPIIQKARVKHGSESRKAWYRVIKPLRPLPLTQTGGHQHILPLRDGGLHHRIMGLGYKEGMVLKTRGIKESLHIKEEGP